MRTERFQKLEQMAADLVGAGRQPGPEQVQRTSVGPQTPPSQDISAWAAPQVDAEAEHEMTITGQPDGPLTGLDLDTTIRLRWVLRDIRGMRTKMSAVRPDDLGILVERGLVAMQDDVPALTNEGHRALD
jgi:hypothetical protein